MTHIQLSISERLNFFPKYKRPIIYTVTMLLVIVGQHYTMQMPLEPFRYIRQSVMSMLFFLCFSGAFLLMVRKSRGRADGLFLFLMFMVGLTNLISLDRKSTRLNSSHVRISYAVFSSK